ncbi:hypothetical protein GJA_3532 [Janthinobacterium agaricidamnosum NBRC 102515 = DSM 9628]|uniref:Uncharacterized protein n=1 Tax=Janthinobacterium agaricidamnosum NBRC 102515 = DSM 9628 TaxID=1349767 RepID=W0V9X1_9BURK|nr:hypothetical protein GJA_3532 [Janthinobacterium agaricidamnosum NBRC 102515 = DSM 9628]
MQLVAIGELAMEQWRAQEATANAKHAYHLAIRNYERLHGGLNKPVSKDAPEHGDVRAFTEAEYKRLQQAKRSTYNLKTRMAKACAKLARISATRPTEQGIAK